MIVIKVGGSSLDSARKILHFIEFIKQTASANKVCLVASAIGKSTSLLAAVANSANHDAHIKDTPHTLLHSFCTLHNKIITELNLREDLLKDKYSELEECIGTLKLMGKATRQLLNKIVSFGEICSVLILSELLNIQKISNVAFDGVKNGFVSLNTEYGIKLLEMETYNNLKTIFDNLEDNVIPIFSGYVSNTVPNSYSYESNKQAKEVSNLGRNSSDYTAAFIAICINAKELWVYKDIEGVFTADPQTIKSSKTIGELSFDEAINACKRGAKFLHSMAIAQCKRRNLPIKIICSGHLIYPPKSVAVVHNNGQKNIEAPITLTEREGFLLTIANTAEENIANLLNNVLGDMSFYAEILTTEGGNVNLFVCNSIKPIVEYIKQNTNTITETEVKNITVIGTDGYFKRYKENSEGLIKHLIEGNNAKIYNSACGSIISVIYSINENVITAKKVHSLFFGNCFEVTNSVSNNNISSTTKAKNEGHV